MCDGGSWCEWACRVDAVARLGAVCGASGIGDRLRLVPRITWYIRCRSLLIESNADVDEVLKCVRGSDRGCAAVMGVQVE